MWGEFTLEDKKSIFEKLRLVDRIEKEPIKQGQDEKNTYINLEESKNDIMEKEIKSTDKEKNLDILINQATVKDKLLSVDDIYGKYNIESKKVNTVFLIDSYVKALPETLPTEIKKQSVLNIIKASNMDIRTLVADGENRLDVLSTYTREITKKTEEVIKEYENKIQELYNRIDEYKNIIAERKSFQEEQRACIDYEVQKIQNTINFIK